MIPSTQALRFGKITYSVEEAPSTAKPYASLSQQEFREVLAHSGLDEELQGAADSRTRLPEIYQPKAFVVVAKDDSDRSTEKSERKPVAVAGFIRMGEYDYLSTLAVHKDYQKQGIGQELIRRGIMHSREQYQSDTDNGFASLATMTAAGNLDEDVPANRAAKKYGFEPLPNGAVLTRSKQPKMEYLA